MATPTAALGAAVVEVDCRGGQAVSLSPGRRAVRIAAAGRGCLHDNLRATDGNRAGCIRAGGGCTMRGTVRGVRSGAAICSAAAKPLNHCGDRETHFLICLGGTHLLL